ncbi:MAG: ATP synthase F1 subunit delta [Clostridiales Family XIII bacterium]|jgi:ATP synthase F1 delta subunit|nr:ATP synthase F1 subunit delta [Clostridiales Family XIII bacterium]
MEDLTVNSVYGLGLYEAAADAGVTETVCESISELERVFKEHPDLFDLLRVPTIAAEKRKRIADEVFADTIPAELLNFIRVLIDKRRMGSFFGIARSFEKLVDERNGVTSGRIVTAAGLSGEQMSRLESETGRLLHKNVKLKEETDRSILGGCRIYIDGKLIDASLKTKLDKLKEELLL